MKTKKYFNIRLFDRESAVSHEYTNKTTDTTASTGNDLSAENKIFYEKRLITMAEPELIFDQFGDKYPIPKNGGKTIEFRRFEPLMADVDATTLQEGITPKGNKLNVTPLTAEVSQKGDYVELSDVIQLTALDPVVVQATKILGSQAGRVSNKITRNALLTCTNRILAPRSDGTETNVRYGTKTVDGHKGIENTGEVALDLTCGINLKLIRKCANALKRNNAPKFDGSYVCIVHPDITTDLQNLDGWIDVVKYKNPEKIFDGEIGKVAGVRFIENTEAKIWVDKRTVVTPGEGGAADTYDTIDLAVYACEFIGKGAYGVTEVTGGGLQHIIKPLGAGEDPLNQRSTVGWKLTKTAEVLVPQYLVRLECTSADSNSTAVAEGEN